MEPTFHVHLRSGNHLGSEDNRLISGDVPDQIKRAGSKGKPKPSTFNADPDFSQPFEVGSINPNPVDTGNQSPSAQDKDINSGLIQNPISGIPTVTLVDRMHGIHTSKDVLEDIKLIKSNGMQDALGQWVPHPNASIQWAAHLVDGLFQLGQAIEHSKADFVVDGQPKHYAMLIPVISEGNIPGSNPVVTTTSASSSSSQLAGNSLTLTAGTLELHEETHPSTVKDNKRPPTPEKDRVKSRGKIVKETYTPYKFGIDGDDDGNDRTPPKVAKYVNYWPQLLPDLCEPTANFEVPVGGIPPPSQRGNIDR